MFLDCRFTHATTSLFQIMWKQMVCIVGTMIENNVTNSSIGECLLFSSIWSWSDDRPMCQYGRFGVGH